VSSEISSDPSGSASTPTGRPQRDPFPVCQPVTKSSMETGFPFCTFTCTTFAPVGTLRFHEPW